MTVKILVLCSLVLASRVAVASDACDAALSEWRHERDYGKKSLLFERLPESCKERVYARSAGVERTSTAEPTTSGAQADLDLSGFYVRGDVGLGAPTGLLGVGVGRQFLGYHSLDLSIGSGSAANFVSASYRRSSSAEGWGWFVGAGGSVGVSKNAGYDPEQHDEDPTTTTTWIHGEAGGQRLGRGAVVLLAFGLERLMSGTYHVDLGDINLVDREPGSVAPYVRIGLGIGF